MSSSMMTFIKNIDTQSHHSGKHNTPPLLHYVCDISSPDPDTCTIVSYSSCDEKSIQQQHVIKTSGHQQWNTSKTTKIKFVTMMSTNPPLIGWCMRYAITGSRYHPHTCTKRMWWKVQTTTAWSQNMASSMMKHIKNDKNQMFWEQQDSTFTTHYQ